MHRHKKCLDLIGNHQRLGERTTIFILGAMHGSDRPAQIDHTVASLSFAYCNGGNRVQQGLLYRRHGGG